MDLVAAGPALLVTALLLAANAFFVLAEYAIVRVRPTQLAELAEAGSRRARLAARIGTRLDAYISTVQVGVTGASLALGIIGEPTVAALLRPILTPLAQLSEPAFHVASFLVAYGLVTYVTLVVSELVPKYPSKRPCPFDVTVTADPRQPLLTDSSDETRGSTWMRRPAARLPLFLIATCGSKHA